MKLQLPNPSNIPKKPVFTDRTSKEYNDVVFELAQHQSIEITIQRTGISEDTLLNLLNDQTFKLDIDNKAKEIKESGINLLQLQMDQAAYEALYQLKEIMRSSDTTEKGKLDAIEKVLKYSSMANKKEESKANQIVINIGRETKTKNNDGKIIDIGDIDG